jgi:uncharacterized protein YndB with AHSA1/START domain
MSDTTLRLERIFDAPREAVFDAWTSPDVLRRWWAAGSDWTTPVAETDLRVGGRYRLSMQDPAAPAPYTVTGEYVEVSRPQRLAYTWSWEDDPPEQAGSRDTLVTVEFHEHGARTRVVLTHSGFAGAPVTARHEHGWHAVMENLERRVALTCADLRSSAHL